MNYIAPTDNGIFPGVNYEVVGATGDISYNGNTIAIGGKFVGVEGVNDYTINSGDAGAQPYATLQAVSIEAASTEDERLEHVEQTLSLQAVTLEAATTADEKRMQDVVPQIQAVCLEYLPPRYFVKIRSKQGRE